MVGQSGHITHQSNQENSKITPSSRILVDVPCKVCHDNSSGKHYGIFACDGCAGFFKRSIRRNRQYVCKNRGQGGCQVDKTHRNQCRSCRLKKCAEAGMNRDAVQHERGPRNSTIRRQMALLMKESNEILSSVYRATPNLFQRFMPPTVITPPATNDISGDQHCTPTSSNSTMTSSSPSDFCNLNAAPAISTPIMSPLMMPAPKYPNPFDFRSYFSTSADTVCETAARLLFACVNWFKTVPAFVNLDMKDQITLLEEGWRENFILCAAQFQMPLEIAPLLANAGLTPETTSSEKLFKIMSELRNFQEIIAKFKQAQVDATEFYCLKAIALFKTSLPNKSNESQSCDSPSSSSSSTADSSNTNHSTYLKDIQSITAFQDQTQLALSKYVATAYPNQPYRFGHLLLLLPALRSVSSQTIEELFFKKSIGSASVDKLVMQMYVNPEVMKTFYC